MAMKHSYKKCKNEFVMLNFVKHHFQKPACWLNFQNISKPNSFIHVWLTIGILFIHVCVSYKFIDAKMFNQNTPLLRILLSKVVTENFLGKKFCIYRVCHEVNS